MRSAFSFGGGLLLFGLVIGVLPANAQLWCYDADDVYAEVLDSTVRIYHDAALYNCCPEYFEFDVQIEGDELIVHEYEYLPNPCYCVCCHDIWIDIEDVPPGEYAGVYHWFDYETGDWQVWLLDIYVPDVGQSGEPHVGVVSEPECLESASVSDPEANPAEQEPQAETWGRIKSLYR